jgi:hypothetical protein
MTSGAAEAVGMNRVAFLGACIVLALAAQPGHAQEPFYKGKRLTILVNFAPGGATDAEARVLVPHMARLIEGQPSVVIQNMEGAVGLTGAKYVGEIAPRDGTLAGYLTGTAFLYALDPERFRVDFKTYEFVGIQPGTSVNFVRTDVPPGMKAPADIMKARGLISAAWGRCHRRARACGSAWICSVFRSSTSADIGPAAPPSWRSSRARSTFTASPRPAISPSSSPVW